MQAPPTDPPYDASWMKAQKNSLGRDYPDILRRKKKKKRKKGILR